MRPVIFLGSNHNILQMTDICEAMGLTVYGIVDSDYHGNCDEICGVPVIGSEQTFNFDKTSVYFNAVNAMPYTSHIRNQNKRRMFNQLIETRGLDTVNLIHPTAIIPRTVRMGSNNMVCAQAIIGNNVTIGDHCQIREQSYVAHDARIHNDVVIQVQSYVGAGVEIMSGSYVAVKASIIPYGADRQLPENTFIKATERVVL